MSNYSYKGVAAFGDDSGTYSPPLASGQAKELAGMSDNEAKKLLKTTSKDLPIVWFVDDERGNREWFRDYHRDHFGVVTFSSRRHFRRALRRNLKCDAIVTDIFFPGKKMNDEIAKSLLAIYPKMEKKPTLELPRLWTKERDSGRWSLDGFSVAQDAAYHKPPIPVFLFSRKATLLLTVDDFIGEFPTVANSYWLLEKINPTSVTEIARKAAELQRRRILAVLALREPAWRKLAKSIVRATEAGAALTAILG